uniref:Secreted protein n=1 Tax=Macrostomum lignano TaxID=282301 RepID=A0A1I8JRM1_9PLAT
MWPLCCIEKLASICAPATASSHSNFVAPEPLRSNPAAVACWATASSCLADFVGRCSAPPWSATRTTRRHMTAFAESCRQHLPVRLADAATMHESGRGGVLPPIA